MIDRIPELIAYRDTGCDIHQSCLTCPLSQCRYDEPGWRQKEERSQRDTAVLEMRSSREASIPELATCFGISTRTVHRILGRPPARLAS